MSRADESRPQKWFVFFPPTLPHLMMITIMVQGCGGSEGDGASDPLFDHMPVEVWLATWPLRAFLDLETPDRVKIFRRRVPFLSARWSSAIPALVMFGAASYGFH